LDFLKVDITIGKIIGPFELKVLWDKQDCLPIEGLYVYSLPSEDAIYVGMGMVGHRVWQHLGPTVRLNPGSMEQEKEQGFPNHRWSGLRIPEIDQNFASGTVLVSAVLVEPSPSYSRHGWDSLAGVA
jgi:hypothetical protein